MTRIRSLAVLGASTTMTLLAAALPVMGLAGSAHADSWDPPTGAFFGRPTGDSNAVRTRLLNYINHTPSGAYIRAVTWAYTDEQITDALIAAHNRGVVVRVLAAKGQVDKYPTQWGRLKSEVGHTSCASSISAADPSCAQAVQNAARGNNTFDGEPTTMHEKSWMFSTVGSAKRLVVVTSANITENAFRSQWTDAFTWGDGNLSDGDDLYAAMLTKFNEQSEDTDLDPSFRTVTFSSSFSVSFGPWNSPSMADPVVQRIKSLPNDGLSIRVAMAAWRGDRGVAIANALAAKKRAGAKVWVLVGEPFGAAVKSILVDAGIPWADGYRSDTYYVHSKYMTARYNEDGAGKARVWMGSENWSDDSRGNDEIVLKFGSAASYNDYVDAFDAAVSAFGGFK